MAKIEMDISEYEIMKENKKLLENSLEKERGLQQRIEQLNKEKIEALEEAKMKVVKISKVETMEHVLVKRDFEDIWGRMREFLLNSFHNNPHQGLLTNRVDSYLQSEGRKLIDICFEKTSSSLFSEPTITTHGLDEIKKELSEKLKKQISENYDREMEVVRNSKNEIQRMRGELQKAEKCCDDVLKQNTELIKDLESKESALKEKEVAIQTLESKLSVTAKIISMINASNAGFFSASAQLKAIKSLAKEVGDEKL